MSKNITTAARMTALETRFDAFEAKFDRVLTALEGRVTEPVETKPAKASKKGKKAKASAKASKAAKAEAPKGKPFGELREILKAHKAAGLVEAGISVKQMIEAGRMDTFGNLLGDAPKAPAKGKKARKVVAEVAPEAPAKAKREVSENHVARVAPRRADGTIPPKSEWAMRESLAETGRFDRYEIDSIVASMSA